MMMAKGQGKTGLIITIIVLALTLGVVSAIVIYQNVNRPADTVEAETPQPDTETPVEEPVTEQPSDPAPIAPDPGDMRSIDVEPMGIKVYYGEGTNGFEFFVKRSNGGTQYAEFSSELLVGTKCTDDQGIFATIVEDPSTSEQQTTVDQTVTVEGVTYGLLLASNSCTSDSQLLADYQDAFREGFGFLTTL